MPVPQAAVRVIMGMRLAWWIVCVVLMLVMKIVHMRVCVNERLMQMFVVMAFSKVKPYTNSHECARSQQLKGYRSVE